jgi:hypothetical protein
VLAAATEKRVRKRGRPYLAYLLRLWQVRNKGQADWRASVENAHTGERQGFASLADLFTFLEGEVGQVDKDQDPPSVGEKGGDIEKQQPD